MSASAAVAETPVRLEIEGRRAGCWTCTPEHADALAIGWLVAEGYFDPREALPGLEVMARDGVLDVRVRLTREQAARGDAERSHRRDCGILHFLRCAPELLRERRGRLPLPDRSVFPDLFRALYAAAERYRDTGGLHSAALTDGVRLRHQVEEVGRHNAVDKVIGRAVLAGDDLTGLGLVLTARVSAEIALKAARGGISWIASRSVPTTLALEIAAAADLPILARAGGKEPRLHDPAAPAGAAG